MTQAKKGIVNSDECTAIYVSANIGKKKATITTSPSLIALGYYDDEKCAIDEIENIAEAIKRNETFYQMP
jgi:hypothetical protein